MEWVRDIEEVAADYSLAWPQSYLQLAADGMLDSRSGIQPFPLLHFSTDFEVLDPPHIIQCLAMLADPDDFRRVDPDQKLLPFGMESNGNLYCFHGAAAEGGSVPIILLQNDEQEDAHLAPDMAGFIFAHMIETATEFYEEDYLGEGNPEQNAALWLESHQPYMSQDHVAVLRELFARPLIHREDGSMGFIEFDDVGEMIDPVLKDPRRHQPLVLWERS